VLVDLGPGVGAAFTTRVGGISLAPYGDLNLGLHVADDPHAVRTNRARTARSLGVEPERVTWADQVHGHRVAVVTEADAGRGSCDVTDALPGADALVTAAPEVPLAILVADCVPVLLADANRRVVGAVHAGRRGLVAGVVAHAVQAMRDNGAALDEVVAVIGPAIGACCYDVGDEVHDEVTGVLPVTAAASRSGGRSLDLVAGVRAELSAAGVSTTTTVGGCTSCQRGFWFSHRRDGVTGRTAAIVWLR